jgi:ABC-2 type transport system permease protein
MRNALIICKRIVRQLLNDRRTLGLIFAAPLIIITLLWVVIDSSASRPRIALSGASAEYAAALADHADLRTELDEASALASLEKGEVDAALSFSEDAPRLKLDGADPSISALSVKAFQFAAQESLSSLNIPLVKRMQEKMTPDISLMHGSKEATAFDYLAPVMMGFVVFFFVFILSGMSFLRERLSGTLERTMASRASRFDVVAGYTLGYGVFALIQTVSIQAFIVYVLKVRIEGGFFSGLVVNLLLCLAALSLGSLLSAFARTEFQVFQFIPIVIMPQILFSGILDLRDAPNWVKIIAKIFPLTYGGDALRNIMLRGHSLADVWPDICVLIGFILFFMLANALIIPKRKPRSALRAASVE